MRDVRITTLSSTCASDCDGECDDGRTCPGVHAVTDRPDVYYVVTQQVTDPDDVRAFDPLVGPGEVLGTVPRGVLDRLIARAPL